MGLVLDARISHSPYHSSCCLGVVPGGMSSPGDVSRGGEKTACDNKALMRGILRKLVMRFTAWKRCNSSRRLSVPPTGGLCPRRLPPDPGVCSPPRPLLVPSPRIQLQEAAPPLPTPPGSRSPAPVFSLPDIHF